ncbi:histone-lysine N-methyltransferase EHMT1-like [Sceloporus undulatus]|uniref:histone-lysine N-methyltransferase EHMT1-like n=1 Tax=Sceloporus undulatus TaxID=8520 RepID=UPI001C4C9DC8|nr:histone-lysine N-methyltransferase EHMT1-like [Sceloporus undulatus]
MLPTEAAQNLAPFHGTSCSAGLRFPFVAPNGCQAPLAGRGGGRMGASGSKCVGPDRKPPKRQQQQEEVEEEAAAEAGDTLLHMVARKGHYVQAQELLSEGATEALHCQDTAGRTPLFWATENKHERLVELLLTHGADPSTRDHEGNICLHRAAFVGSAPIARMLLEAGSEVDVPNSHGNCPLHLAAQESRYECLVLLLALGAPVWQRNKAGRLPLDCVRRGSTCWKALRAMAPLSSDPPVPQRILSRDISRGFEAVPIPCLNGLDEEGPPGDFLYVTQNLVSDSAEAPLGGWARSQCCTCGPRCSPDVCPCLRRGRHAWYSPDGRLALDATGETPGPGPVFECHLLCSCGSSCPNRVAQRGLRTQLQLYRTPSKGFGVRTMEDLPPGAFLCQYFGELISRVEAAQREEDAYYFLVAAEAGGECCLDGHFFGSVGRFLNHSCQPNLLALPVVVGSEIPGIAFFSARAIRAGEELGFDYGEAFWAAQRRRGLYCHCRGPRCRYPPLPSPAAPSETPGPSRIPRRGFALKTPCPGPLPRAEGPKKRRTEAPATTTAPSRCPVSLCPHPACAPEGQ